VDIDTTVADGAAAYLRSVTPEGSAVPVGDDEPEQAECLRCYVDRMVASHGCDTSLRFTRRWLTGSSFTNPTRLLRWFESSGGYCDCEVLMNVLTEHWPKSQADGEP
jgi:hypothetical protein